MGNTKYILKFVGCFSSDYKGFGRADPQKTIFPNFPYFKAKESINKEILLSMKRHIGGYKRAKNVSLLI